MFWPFSEPYSLKVKQPLVALVVLLDETGVVVGNEDIAFGIDRDAFRLVQMLVLLALAAEPGEELAAGLVECLHIGVRRVGRQQMAFLAEGEVLDILELAFAGADSADIHHVFEFQIGRHGRAADRSRQAKCEQRQPRKSGGS